MTGTIYKEFYDTMDLLGVSKAEAKRCAAVMHNIAVSYVDIAVMHNIAVSYVDMIVMPLLASDRTMLAPLRDTPLCQS